MKAFYAIFLLVFLASCGSDTVQTTVAPSDNLPAEEVTQEIENAIDDLPEELEDELDEQEEESTQEESAWSDDLQEDTVEEEQAEDDEVSESKVEILDAAYTNPKWPVDMEIAYTLDADGKIQTISASATTYDVAKFNDGIQSVIWLTLEEASDTYVTGSSLTSAAFNNAIKGAL